ncbi:MAG: hypothetical protein AAGA92_09535 [Planctomycetota bacterium]
MADNLTKPGNGEAEGWSPCAAGELTQAARSAASARRQSKWTEAGPTVVACLLMSIGGLYYISTEDGPDLNVPDMNGVGPGTGLAESLVPPYGGISCSACSAQFKAFHDHQLKTVLMADADLLERVTQHLLDCKICRAKYNKMYPGTPLKEVARELIRTGADPVLLAAASGAR